MLNDGAHEFLIYDEVKLPSSEFQSQVWEMVADVVDDFFSDESGVDDKQSCMAALERCVDDIVVAYEPDGNLAAFVYLVGLRHGLSCTMHGFVRKDLRSPRYTSQAFRGMVDPVFRKHRLIRLEALVPVHNRASKLLLLRAGFQCDGELRNFARFKGVPTNFWIMSTIRG